MSFGGTNLKPLIFGGDTWTITSPSALAQAGETAYAETNPQVVSTNNRLAHRKCGASIRFSAVSSSAKVAVLRLTLEKFNSQLDTESLKTGVDIQGIFHGTNLGYADVISSTIKSGSIEYWDFYWRLPNLSNPGSQITRFEVFGYVIGKKLGSDPAVYSKIRIYTADLYFGSATDISVPDIGTSSAYYTQNYPGLEDVDYSVDNSKINDFLITSPTFTLEEGNKTLPALPPVLPPLPPSPPPPPVPPTAAPTPPRGEDGRLLGAVPFRVAVQPQTMLVRAGRGGLFSGELEVSVQVIPGGSQGRTYKVTDKVVLSAGQAPLVQMITKETKTFQPVTPQEISLTLSSNLYAVKTGFVHRHTGKIFIQNNMSEVQTLLITAKGPGLSGQGTQSIISFERTVLTLAPGEVSPVIYSLVSNSALTESEAFVIEIQGSFGEVLAAKTLVVNHHPANTLGKPYYIDGPTDYIFTIGSAVNIPLQTLNGGAGDERWRVVDPTFLLSHNIMFSPTGWLSSSDVVGPSSMVSIMFVATVGNEVAARVLNLRVQV